MSQPAEPTVQCDNGRVRVTRWHFKAAGAATGFHRHEYDYVVVPMTSGRLAMLDADGNESSAELVAGQSYFRGAGVEHDVINANEHEFTFVEIELKS